MRLVVEDRAGNVYLESEPEAPASYRKFIKLKRLLIRLGLTAKAVQIAISQTHFNIANNVHQVFFFVCMFVKMDRGKGA